MYRSRPSNRNPDLQPTPPSRPDDRPEGFTEEGAWDPEWSDDKLGYGRDSHVGIVANKTFILATRETGYRSVEAAISELIDNAIQAAARRIRILVRDEDGAPDPATGRFGAGYRSHHLTICVLDDGTGMDPELMRQALRFGGTSRFNDRSGPGRFGMGLPNSSVSQSRRLDVFSWQAPGVVYHSYLDIDEVVDGRLREIPAAKLASLPIWAMEGGSSVSTTGTLIVWSRCDRLGRRRAATLAERLRKPLGQAYRYALWNGVEISLNGLHVDPVDPIFTHPRALLAGAVPYGAPLTYEITVPSRDATSTVEVLFAELPVAKWSSLPVADKRNAGIVGGAGISIVRAGREIDFGWYLMGAKRRENYDDWWRCEIRFSPELDELFGVTHSKQGINPRPELRSLLEPDLERIARALNARVRDAFEQLKAEERAAEGSPALRAAAVADRFLQPPPTRGLASPRKNSPPRPRQRPRSTDGVRYAIEVRPIDGPEFFRVVRKNGGVVVVINHDHPFFAAVYQPSIDDPTGRERFGLECLLLAAARAELAVSSADKSQRWVTEMRQHWSDALAAFLEP